MILTRDEAFNAVCEILTPTAKGVVAGTGMFVCKQIDNVQYGWILTASHIAKDTNDSTSIVVATKEGKSEILPLHMFGNVTSWLHHRIADMSVLPITFTEINIRLMNNRFFPYEQCNLEMKSVSRDFELTSIGFPRGLGANGSFSPFTFRSYASSGFVTLLRADTNTPCDFFCLENPSVGGYSGCPVFDLGYINNGVMSITKENTVCHGIMHGTILDDTGGKIAMVTPMFYLKDLIG